jgi:hypothetical protein
VHGNHLRSCAYGTAGDIGSVEAFVVPAEAHFDRHWEGRRLDNSLDERKSLIGHAHQR